MSDVRLYTEIALTLDSGFHTIKAPQLNALYKKYNAAFEPEDDYRRKVSYGINFFIDHEILHKPSFLRLHVVQSIALAAIALRFRGAFDEEARAKQAELVERLDGSPVELDVLADTIQDPDAYSGLQDFTSLLRAPARPTWRPLALSAFSTFAQRLQSSFSETNAFNF